MRGKECSNPKSCMRQGITPAYAGKSPRASASASAREDHPRLCGEKHRWELQPHTFIGSPPPMRGKDESSFNQGVFSGITPAYAGKSSRQRPPGICPVGSPPPMRGKVPGLILVHLTLRITPAYAGKRLPITRNHARKWDHPRLCGEKRYALPRCQPMWGSPPPMRGKAAHYTGGSIECRITPAYAGKS